jgi:hypothetical protein
LYAGRRKLKPFTSDFREVNCKNCIKSAHYWRIKETATEEIPEPEEEK